MTIASIGSAVTVAASFNPSIAALADGGWVALYDDGGNGETVRFRRFDKDGNPQGAEIVANNPLAGFFKFALGVEGLSDGRFVVTWGELKSDGSAQNAIMRVFNANGTTAEERVLGTDSLPFFAPVTALANGHHAVAFVEQFTPDSGPQETRIVVARFNGNTKLGGNVVVTGFTPNYESQPFVTALADGGFMVTWERNDGDFGEVIDGGGVVIVARLYNANGTPKGGPFIVNSTSAHNNFRPSADQAKDGAIMIAWEANNADRDIRARFLNADGTAKGPDILVSAEGGTFSAGVGALEVTALADGRFLVAWLDSDAGGNARARLYRSDGTPASAEFMLQAGEGHRISVAELASGDLAVGWRATGEAIKTLRFDPTDFVGTAGADSYDGGDRNDAILGLGGDDVIFGHGGDDTIGGGGGGDTLRGGDGNDTLSGAGGDDGLFGEAGDDRLDGGNGDDRLFGGGGTDLLLGGDGDDTLLGGGGNDELRGGKGKDDLDGGGGNDALFGEDGGDELNGGAGNDGLDGGSGNDRLFGGAGDDGLLGGTGKDRLEGGGGKDLLDGGDGNDTLFGGAGNDRLFGGAGKDTLDGGAGRDRLDGGSGADTMRGGAGVDTYIVDSKGDVVDETGGSGADVVRSSINFSLAKAGRVLGDVEHLVLTGAARNGTGNGLANEITGNGHDNRLDGRKGNDTLEGLGGKDTLFGGAGNDRLEGGSGDDILDGGAGADVLDGGAGNDQLDGGAGSDVLTGLNGKDRLFGGAGKDTLDGGTGDDVLTGGAGADALAGGDGKDTASYAGAAKGVTASLANPAKNKGDARGDTFSSIENLTGSSKNDRLVGDGKANLLRGGGGNDMLEGRAGNDTLHGEGGRDTLDGGAGNDTLNGGSGDDVLIGNAGNDKLVGGLGADELNGGDGRDTFIFVALTDSTSASGGRDYVADFSQADKDRIDVSAIDTDAVQAGDQKFVFIATAAFSGAGGELRVEEADGDTYVLGDVDGDGLIDFAIQLQGSIDLKKADFVL